MIGHSLFTFIHPDDLDTVKDETEKVFLAVKESGNICFYYYIFPLNNNINL